MTEIQSKVIVALDYASSQQALAFVETVSPQQCRLKVGKELFTREGPQLVKTLVDRGFDIFLDLKFHDIPHTVNKAVIAACELGVWMLNVHAMGGEAMMTAAREALEMSSNRKPHLIAVSVLTSTSQREFNELGFDMSIQQAVVELTRKSLNCGLDGMVCSAAEAKMLRTEFGATPILVTPGIRPLGANSDDQQRIMTPQQAIQDGSSYLVIGRPITRSENPANELDKINSSLL